MWFTGDPVYAYYDQDCLVGDSTGYVFYFENTGDVTTASWSLESEDYFDRNFGEQASPWCGDLDGDGDMVREYLYNAHIHHMYIHEIRYKEQHIYAQMRFMCQTGPPLSDLGLSDGWKTTD